MSNFNNNRPISPHLQIYKLIPTMFVSIAHRITGSVVYLGTPGVVLWFFCVASGKSALSYLRYYTESYFLKICFFLYTWAIIHHMLGGIRYLIWDSGLCFDKRISTQMAKINIIVAIVLVSIIWIVKDLV
ncbi:succinate dehydrogenase, cytochrome b556 subunit [Candidatus Liberibacter brunswickensis]|uniref:succinate dehydrogenase, cytochrome b556 subunit n=1 Tax=Candidatus Liberibacter brunswickensis TaxID=1968796 RepID=UPI002FE41C6E